jgi:NADH dehydrogenase [ubiquinone] 1 alpha subcomplex assembly factor 5
MPPPLFDNALRAMRRDRAARLGPELFLFERVFEDCLERIAALPRTFDRALLLGCPDPAALRQLREVAVDIDVVDPGALFSADAGGQQIVEDLWEPEPGRYDLALAIGTLDTVNDLPRALLAIRLALGADGLLIGAFSGGETLPQLRSAMRAGDQIRGGAVPHVHPRIEPSALAGLLSAAEFERPVVDVDRVAVSYASLDRLVADLRRMAATNVLSGRGRRPLSRSERDAARSAFLAAGDGGRTVETFEILHLAGWTAAA